MGNHRGNSRITFHSNHPFLEYRPSKPKTPDIQSLKADSLILIKQDNLTEKMNELIKYCKPDTAGKNNSKELQKK